ncbi:hypothetical protein [Sinorhizobium sojae]|uniref:hypothetical protein n=1 Tax=Sinorhizobium sojae TaxID=716925 RepID=UPI0004B7D7FF|nr:hypothetical protein [Sinorhizobium sojae]
MNEQSGFFTVTGHASGAAFFRASIFQTREVRVKIGNRGPSLARVLGGSRHFRGQDDEFASECCIFFDFWLAKRAPN